MKFKISLIAILSVLVFSLTGCEDDNLNNKTYEAKTNISVIDYIKRDIENNKNYTNVNNQYDYTKDYIKDWVLLAYSNDSNGYSDKDLLNSSFKTSLGNKGYNADSLNNMLSEIESYSSMSVRSVVNEINNNESYNEVEINLINEIVDQFVSSKSLNETKRISNIITYHVNRSNKFSTKQKKDILTINSAFVGIRELSDIENVDWFNTTYGDDDSLWDDFVDLVGGEEEVNCAGDVLIPVAAGAAAGNGVGGAAGIVVGIWNAYRNGCMD